ncbi:hypothetical protein ACFL6U_09015 [Planctomycetota bacterium]
MAIPQWLANILEYLGIKQSEAAKYKKMKEVLIEKKAGYVDQLESLKDKIMTLQRKLREKESEYNNAKGRIREIVTGEIQRLFKDLDRTKESEAIIGQGIEKASLTISKVESIILAKHDGVEEEVFDELIVDLQEDFAELKRTDRAAKDLESVRYDAPPETSMEVESRMAELESSAASTKESAGELPQSTVQRLRELADEES